MLKKGKKRELTTDDLELLSTYAGVSGGRRCLSTINVTINCTSDKDKMNCQAAGIKGGGNTLPS